MPKKVKISDFEKKHLANTAQNIKRIKRAYEGAIDEITIGIDFIRFKGEVFKVSDYPILKKKIDAQIKKLQPQVHSLMLNGLETSWNMSNEKNNLIVDRRIGNKYPDPKVKKIYYDPNKQVFDAFTKRRVDGLNLSDRVWRCLDPFKSELEAGLSLGISEGKSAAIMAKEMKQYLNDPDKLFRKVKNAEGKLVLSKAAREYHPGQGVYRSSYKNAVRLTRTENNIAYRTSDHERWKTLPFVTGIEVKLSDAHPRYDICDPLAGQYPKDFKHTGWHPQCLCYAVPIMMNDDEYSKLEDSILGIKDFDPASVKTVDRVPASFSNYMEANAEKIGRWKSKPYWINDNPKYLQ